MVILRKANVPCHSISHVPSKIPQCRVEFRKWPMSPGRFKGSKATLITLHRCVRLETIQKTSCLKALLHYALFHSRFGLFSHFHSRFGYQCWYQKREKNARKLPNVRKTQVFSILHYALGKNVFAHKPYRIATLTHSVIWTLVFKCLPYALYDIQGRVNEMV